VSVVSAFSVVSDVVTVISGVLSDVVTVILGIVSVVSVVSDEVSVISVGSVVSLVSVVSVVNVVSISFIEDIVKPPDRSLITKVDYLQCAVMSAPVQVNGSYTSVITVTGEEVGCNEDDLFDPSLLSALDFLNCKQVSFPPGLSVSSPGSGLKVRPLQLSDYDRGFLQLLGQLTTVGQISWEEWEDRFSEMKSGSGGGTYFVVVVEDTEQDRVVGAATLVVERKFIHQCGQVGRLEDVVVSDQYRGRQLGKLVVSVCSLLAFKLSCYKMTLNCQDKMIKFYSSLGYKSEEGNDNYMCVRLGK